jgi:hypothetical protein
MSEDKSVRKFTESKFEHVITEYIEEVNEEEEKFYLLLGEDCKILLFLHGMPHLIIFLFIERKLPYLLGLKFKFEKLWEIL